jgi:hypothetical protein
MATLKSFYGTMKRLWVHVDAKTKDVEEWVPSPLDILQPRVPELI